MLLATTSNIGRTGIIEREEVRKLAEGFELSHIPEEAGPSSFGLFPGPMPSNRRINR
jgi:hypothetical protein